MIKAYNVEIPERSNAGKQFGGPNVDDIRAFLASGAKNAEIEWDKQKDKNVVSVQSNYGAAIKRLGLSDKVGTKTRSGRLFLIRKDV